jgi:cbb3-type cytochrome oxidase subunit 3
MARAREQADLARQCTLILPDSPQTRALNLLTELAVERVS